jgi:hypothetical protein
MYHSTAPATMGRSIIQFLIRRIGQFLNSPIQFIDFIELINLIRNLRIEAICDQFAGWSSIKFRVRLSMHQLLLNSIPNKVCNTHNISNAGCPNAPTFLMI